MARNILLNSVLFVLISLASNLNISHASDTSTGLCPPGFTEGIASTGFVTCFDSASSHTDREDAEQDRLELEAICNTVANSEVISSLIMVTSSGRFFAEVACRIRRPIPAGTIICPVDSDEVIRAYDTLVCKYFGDAVTSPQLAQTALNAQTAECVSTGGSVLESELEMGEVLGGIVFYFATSACGIPIPPLDVFECPFGYDENFRTLDTLECDRLDGRYETLAEADQVNLEVRAICTDTTANLGVVTESITTATSLGEFISDVTCTITIPRYNNFTDTAILRACDTTCTEDVEQTRQCINGGVVGQPGCVEPAIQVIARKCNTGIGRDTACPIMGIPAANIVPLLLLDDD